MNLSPPWMSGSKEINKQPMLVVHMNDGELEGLDNLQGGPSIDPDTGLREYSTLAEIIEIPAIQEVFKRVSAEIENHGEISSDLKRIYNSAKKHGFPYVETPEEKHDPLKSLEHAGREGDTKLALIPMNLALFLIDLRHEPSINPKTGLLEFKKRWYKRIFKNVIPVAATIAGGFLGGPIGAGIGNTLGQAATGRDLKTSAMRGLKIGALAYGAQGLGQAAGLTGSTPMTGGFFGGSPNLVAQGLGKAGIGSASASASTMPPGQLVSSPKGWLQMTPSGKYIPAQMAGSDSGGLLSGLGNIAGSVGGFFGNGQQTGMSSGNEYDGQGGFLDGILGNKGDLLKALGVGALAYKGAKKDEKREKREKREQEERIERMREELGFNRSFTPYRRNRRVNPRFHQHDELKREYGVFDEPYYIYDDEPGYAKGGLVRSYNKGMLVRGPGKGQDDKIKTSIPSGSYIIDASSTSMFGDGSTKAGSEVLKQFENHIKRKFPKHFMKEVERTVSHQSEIVPVWLSEGEYKFDPVTVTALGKGSNTKGASILKDMVIKLRKHKNSRGTSLPPKAKDPSYYIGGK